MRLPVGATGAILLAGTLLAAPAQAAQGVNLRWDRCHGDGGSENRAFACDTNAGAEVLVCSFVLDAPLAQVSGNEVVIDLLTQDDPVPPWWHFRDLGSCRVSSLGMNTFANVDDVACVDWAAGNSTGGVGFYGYELGPGDPSLATRQRRIKIALAVSQEHLADLAAETEYFACNVPIDHAKSVGSDACAGCAAPVCLVLQSVRVTTPSPGNGRILYAPASAGSQIVTWQGVGPNCQLVPVKRSTWGAVKGLYR
jgi:hypothetical protein